MNLEHPSLNIFAGSVASGKTHLLKYFIYSSAIKLQFNNILVITPTIEDYPFIPENWVHIPYKPEYVEELLKKIILVQSSFEEAPRILLIIDDCLGSINFQKPFITQILTRFRHPKLNLSICITTQHIHKIPAFIRENCTTAFIFSLTSKNAIKAGYESFGSKFKNEKEFKEFINKLHKYEFALYNKRDGTYRKLSAPNKIPEFKLKY